MALRSCRERPPESLLSWSIPGENQIAVGAGANSAVTAQQVSLALSEVLGRTGCVLVSTEIPEESVVAAVEAAISSGVPCILNPAPVVPAVLRLLRRGPLLTPNATELIALVAALDQSLPDTHISEMISQVICRR